MADHDLQPDLQYEDDHGWEQWDEVGDYDDSPVFASTSLDIKPAPVPWYRTGPAVFALAAISLALLAIVVAAVLLVSQDSSSTDDDVKPLRPITDAPSSPSEPRPSASESAPKPSPSASPSPSPSESPSDESPAPPPPPERDRPSSPSDSDGPRTNITRAPISVHPSVPAAHPGY